jgi:hypothetical protein
MGKISMKDFVTLFSCEELWTVPISSFVECYCLIFMPDEDEQPLSSEELAEQKKIFSEYKLLINEILTSTLLRKHRSATFNQLLASLGEYVSDNEFLSNRAVFESLKYMLAVEDFKVFVAFMEDMNLELND